jgi:hypothetical protein
MPRLAAYVVVSVSVSITTLVIVVTVPLPPTPDVGLGPLVDVVDGAIDVEIQLPGIAPGPEVIIVVIVVDAGMAIPLGRITIGIPLIVVVVSDETVGMAMVLPPTTTEPDVGVYGVP